MKSAVQAVVLFATTLSGLVVPSRVLPVYSSTRGHLISSSTAADAFSVVFSIPCRGYSGDLNEEWIIELKSEGTSLSCQPSAVLLNDVRLSSVSISFDAISSLGRVRTVTGLWQFFCLEDDITLLSVSIDGNLGQPQSQSYSESGFSAFFRQNASPELLDLQYLPLTGEFDTTIFEEWGKSQSSTAGTSNSVTQTKTSLHKELRERIHKLYEIEDHLHRNHCEWTKKKRRILQTVRRKFGACSGPTCIVQTALNEAPRFFELIKAQFKHRSNCFKLQGIQYEGIRKQSDTAIMYGGLESADDDLIFHDELYLPQFDETSSTSTPGPDPARPETTLTLGVPLPLSPPQSQPQPTPTSLRQSQDFPQSPNPYSFDRGSQEHNDSYPHFFHSQRVHPYLFLFSFVSILFFVIAAGLLFKCLRTKTGLFYGSRERRERAARREESRSRAAYRLAAAQYRWKQWWSRFRRAQSTSDDEEKRTRILRQENTLDGGMEPEIRDLRRAHEAVEEMLRTEDASQRLYHAINFSSLSQPPYPSNGPQLPDGERSTLNDATLPPYQPAPPSYEQDLHGEITVANGFLYTSSATDSSPDSSVVDCHTRLSFDTSTTLTRG